MSRGPRAAAGKSAADPGELRGSLPGQGARILAVDCQWDGSPVSGDLLEIGWIADSPCGCAPPGELKTFVLLHPEPGSVSDRSLSLTGITREELAAGTPVEEVARELAADLGGVAAIAAHTAWYEKRFVLRLLGPEAAPPPFLCTFEAAKELLPGLSGYGLRAVAGYLGIPPPRNLRVGEQVEATRLILRALVEMECGGTGRPRSPMRLDRAMLRTLPAGPGVYRLLDCSGRPLYIGKASSLKNRIRQHFSPGAWKAKDGLVSAIWDIDWEETETGLEAALLEPGMILEQKPMANRAMTRLPSQLCWLSDDFSACGGSPSGILSLGPLIPGRILADALRVASALASPGTCTGRLSELDWPDEPDQEVLSVGMALLLGLGAPVSGRLDEAVEWAGGQPPVEGEEEPGSPEAFALRLRSVLTSAAAALARSSRLAALACSVVGFAENNRVRMLRFCGGRMVEARWEDEGGVSANCPPPGHAVASPVEYRRLSVLAGEISRMERAGGIRLLMPEGPAREPSGS